MAIFRVGAPDRGQFYIDPKSATPGTLLSKNHPPATKIARDSILAVYSPQHKSYIATDIAKIDIDRLVSVDATKVHPDSHLAEEVMNVSMRLMRWTGVLAEAVALAQRCITVGTGAHARVREATRPPMGDASSKAAFYESRLGLSEIDVRSLDREHERIKEALAKQSEDLFELIPKMPPSEIIHVPPTHFSKLNKTLFNLLNLVQIGSLSAQQMAMVPVSAISPKQMHKLKPEHFMALLPQMTSIHILAFNKHASGLIQALNDTQQLKLKAHVHKLNQQLVKTQRK